MGKVVGWPNTALTLYMRDDAKVVRARATTFNKRLAGSAR